ncbi:hypothetical protein, partial [Candidatus Avelusimicrobium facis]|uniref:hypothetical protein n=1 Tax=Candidatus Avelusimicrobium facis TaxID=3416203 RepID=UPI003D0F1FE6
GSFFGKFCFYAKFTKKKTLGKRFKKGCQLPRRQNKNPPFVQAAVQRPTKGGAQRFFLPAT